MATPPAASTSAVRPITAQKTTAMPPLPSSTDKGPPPVQLSAGSSASTAAPATAADASAAPPSESNALDASSGPLRDGRIRDPVPSKLKGKTDGSKGNFSVMHMEVIGRGEATDRDAEAKRTSESTELAAKRAFENGYVSLRRSRFVHLPDEPMAKPFVPFSTSGPTSSQFQRRTPLGPEEAKSEQARLLTVLRSLHPVLVVDQICKALAFFGGIPGAPPPADGGFPESAEANGSGSLFVGWIAEIFPKLGGNSAQQSLDPTRRLDDPQPVKRKRGRPKGSKATKARKDKGIKKGPKKAPPDTDQHHPPGVSDESWVGVDDSAAPTDEADVDAMLLVQATSPQAQLGTSHLIMAPGTPGRPPGAIHRTALPDGLTASGAAADGVSSARKRGRPKGSKNRPKNLVADSMQTPCEASQAGSQPSQDSQLLSQAHQVPVINQAARFPTGPGAAQSFTAVNSVSPAPSKKRAGKARGQGPKQQDRGQAQDGHIRLGSEEQGESRRTGSSGSESATQAPVAPYQTPQALQGPHARNWTLPTPHTASPAPAKASRNAGQRRKRKLDGDAPSRPRLNDQGNNGSAALPEVNAQAPPVAPNNSRLPPPTAAAEPPSKRQRKTRESRLPERDVSEVVAQAVRRDSAISTAEGLPADSTPNQSPRPGPVPPPAVTHNPEQAMVSGSLVEPPVPSMHLPQQGRLGVQPPTMDNLEAQLQAQFEQQPDVQLQTLASQSAPESALLMAGRLSQQQRRQQQQREQQQRQQLQQRQQHQNQNQNHGSIGHDRSPNLQSMTAKSHVANSPLVAQQQTRTPQNHYNQYRTSGSQYHKQQQQDYVSSQTEQPQPQQQQQFSGGRQHAQRAQASPAQPYSTTAPQPQQYTSSQQAYSSGQQQYSGGQQLLAPQQRYQQQLAAPPAGTPAYTTHQTPQFGTSASGTFGTADGGYRSPVATTSNPSYGQRTRSVTPSAATSFRATSAHGMTQHSPPFDTGTVGIQQRSTSHPTSQSMQGLATVQAFAGNAGADWSLFDTSHLEASGQQGTMGLSNAGYGISAASVRASPTTGPAFSGTALTTFDAPGLGNGERCYGVGRR